MKKLAFILALSLSGTMAFAQKQCDCNFLPEAKDFALEIQFNPFANSFNSFQLNNVTLQGRYFLDSKNALRFNVGLGVDNNKDLKGGDEPIKTDLMTDLDYRRELAEFNLYSKDYTFTSSGDLIVAAGYERHFPVGKRVDAYTGGQIGFDWHWENSKKVDNLYDNWASTTSSSFKNTWQNIEKVNGQGATFAFIAGAVAGVDFYICKGLFIGAEIGLNMNAKTNCNYKTTYSTGDPSVASDKRTIVVKTINKDSSFNVECYAIKALRLGWKF